MRIGEILPGTIQLHRLDISSAHFHTLMTGVTGSEPTTDAGSVADPMQTFAQQISYRPNPRRTDVPGGKDAQRHQMSDPEGLLLVRAVFEWPLILPEGRGID